VTDQPAPSSTATPLYTSTNMPPYEPVVPRSTPISSGPAPATAYPQPWAKVDSAATESAVRPRNPNRVSTMAKVPMPAPSSNTHSQVAVSGATSRPVHPAR